jgi:SAM-dependent methyltransferase
MRPGVRLVNVVGRHRYAVGLPAPTGAGPPTNEREQPMSFDPVRYKVTTRQQWEDAADAWHRWGPTLEAWLGQVTERMLDAAGVGPGSQVLDVAAGAGGQSVTAARRAGPAGRVLATDISPTILSYAAKSAATAGLTNLQTLEADGEALQALPAQSFDAVICRVGLIYFPDRQRALAGMRRALRDGGRIAAVVYSTPERNEFFSLPVSIIRTRAELPPPQPGQPGPFSLGAPGVLEQALVEAGFGDVSVQTVPAPLRLPSAAECTRFERESFGALHQMLAGLPAEQHPAVWDDIESALRRFETGTGFAGPCEMLVGAGTR